jgi:hypothetical protein
MQLASSLPELPIADEEVVLRLVLRISNTGTPDQRKEAM